MGQCSVDGMFEKMKVANERETRRAWWIRVSVRVFLVIVIEFDEDEQRRKEKDERENAYGDEEVLHG